MIYSPKVFLAAFLMASLKAPMTTGMSFTCFDTKSQEPDCCESGELTKDVCGNLKCAKNVGQACNLPDGIGCSSNLHCLVPLPSYSTGRKLTIKKESLEEVPLLVEKIPLEGIPTIAGMAHKGVCISKPVRRLRLNCVDGGLKGINCKEDTILNLPKWIKTGKRGPKVQVSKAGSNFEIKQGVQDPKKVKYCPIK